MTSPVNIKASDLAGAEESPSAKTVGITRQEGVSSGFSLSVNGLSVTQSFVVSNPSPNGVIGGGLAPKADEESIAPETAVNSSAGNVSSGSIPAATVPAPVTPSVSSVRHNASPAAGVAQRVDVSTASVMPRAQNVEAPVVGSHPITSVKLAKAGSYPIIRTVADDAAQYATLAEDAMPIRQATVVASVRDPAPQAPSPEKQFAPLAPDVNVQKNFPSAGIRVNDVARASGASISTQEVQSHNVQISSSLQGKTGVTLPLNQNGIDQAKAEATHTSQAPLTSAPLTSAPLTQAPLTPAAGKQDHVQSPIVTIKAPSAPRPVSPPVPPQDKGATPEQPSGTFKPVMWRVDPNAPKQAMSVAGSGHDLENGQQNTAVPHNPVVTSDVEKAPQNEGGFSTAQNRPDTGAATGFVQNKPRGRATPVIPPEAKLETKVVSSGENSATEARDVSKYQNHPHEDVAASVENRKPRDPVAPVAPADAKPEATGLPPVENLDASEQTLLKNQQKAPDEPQPNNQQPPVNTPEPNLAGSDLSPAEAEAAQPDVSNGPEVMTSASMHAQVVEGVPALIEPWVEALLLAARTLGIQTSPELIRSASVWAGESDFHDAIVDVAQSAGLTAQFVNWTIRDLSQIMLPALIPISSKYVGMIVSVNDDIANIVVPVSGQLIERSLPINQLKSLLLHPILLVRETEAARDGRVDDFMAFQPKSWFLDIFKNNKGTFFELCLGSLFGNILAVGTSLFAMQVWDRVVPARSTETLWVLASGVFLALIIEFAIRTGRTTLADHFGKRADLKLSAMFFARALDIKSDARPKSPGTMISQLRDLEQMRELLTSTTMGVMLDLPFVFAFLFIIWMIGGPLVWVSIAAIPLLILPGLIIQYPLSALAGKGLTESALRNALLMETIHRVEDIKILQAEPRFRNLWNKVNRVSADISMKQRLLGSLLMNFTSTVQQLAYIGVVIAGVYGILDGTLTFGAVLACSILTSRTIAPLGQVTAVFTRLQNARVSKKALDGLLALPVDHDREKDGYHKPNLVGSYRFDKVIYGYDPQEPPILSIPSLKIDPGEKIAILGRVGAGKSTLLRLAGGLAQPLQGRILFNGLNMDLIDVADVRRDIGFLMQDASLFYGTLRENLMLGNPMATDEEILEAMHISCADQLLLNQPHGLDLVLREGGKGLSGGQKQTLMMARMILRSPKILLLDEPTASLDEATEFAIIERLGKWLGKRTMIVATHRYSVLSLVDRIIVIEGGKVVLDGPKDQIINNIKQNSPSLDKREGQITDKKPVQTQIEKNNG